MKRLWLPDYRMNKNWVYRMPFNQKINRLKSSDKPMNQELPRIGIAIIGINESANIADCINAIREVDYPQNLLEIIYVDGGSRDESPQIAREKDVKVVELKDTHPTPGRGRNIGWKNLDTRLIQFLDADIIVDPQWFKRAVTHLDEKIAAVCGLLKEKFPDRNIYHILAQIEWQYETGLCPYFGGGVLLERDILEKTGGFDEGLIAGEDPELSYRIRRKGWSILRIDSLMGIHDIDINSFKGYLKRAFRGGHAYAEIALRFINMEEKLWLRKLIGIIARTLVPYLIIIIGYYIDYFIYSIVLSLLFLFRPLFRIPKIKKTYIIPLRHSILYAFHYIIVDYPQFFGVCRYLLGRIIGAPLRNQGYPETDL